MRSIALMIMMIQVQSITDAALSQESHVSPDTLTMTKIDIDPAVNEGLNPTITQAKTPDLVLSWEGRPRIDNEDAPVEMKKLTRTQLKKRQSRINQKILQDGLAGEIELRAFFTKNSGYCGDQKYFTNIHSIIIHSATTELVDRLVQHEWNDVSKLSISLDEGQYVIQDKCEIR